MAVIPSAYPWETEPLEYLMRVRFPMERAHQAPLIGLRSRDVIKQDEGYLQRAREYRNELSKMPREELLALAAEVAKEEAIKATARRDAEEAQRFFNRPNATLDVHYWSRMSIWTIDEATALSFGKDPRHVNWDSLKSLVQVSPFAVAYREQRELFNRAKLAGQLWDSTIPNVFLAWAARMRVEMPSELIDAVKALGIQVADWKTLFDNQKHESQAAISKKEVEIDELRQRVLELTASIAVPAQPSSPSEKPLGARERESLLKLVIGMAVSGYGYDPHGGRSEKIREIASDLEGLGVALDVDTVRKYVNEARELLPPPETEQKR